MTHFTMKRIIKNYRDEQNSFVIKWTIRSLKFHLNFFDEQTREEYCEWCIIQLNNDAIFIFSDEIYIKVGGSSRKKQKIFRSFDVSSELYSMTQFLVQFIVMMWDVCCENKRIERFYYCWILSEISEWKLQHKEEFKKKNEKRLQICEKQMKQTIISSTEEHEEFEQINDRIDEFNAIN